METDITHYFAINSAMLQSFGHIETHFNIFIQHPRQKCVHYKYYITCLGSAIP